MTLSLKGRKPSSCLSHERAQRTSLVMIPKPGHLSYVQAKYFHHISFKLFLLKTMKGLMDRYIKYRALVE